MSLYFTMGHPFPLKIAPAYKGSGPYLIHGSWAHPISQFKWHLNWYGHLCRAHSCYRQKDKQRLTDRQTDHATWSATTGHIYVRGTTMRPNNKLTQRVKTHSTKQWQMRLFSNNAMTYTHRAINTGKDMSQACHILFTSEYFNHCRVSGEKLESAEEVDQEFMMDDVIHTLTSLHNHVCKCDET